MNPYRGITIHLAVPPKYTDYRSELRRMAKESYPGAAIRARIVSGVGHPTVTKVFLPANHPLLSAGEYGHPPDGEQIIMSSLEDKFGRWALRKTD